MPGEFRPSTIDTTGTKEVVKPIAIPVFANYALSRGQTMQQITERQQNIWISGTEDAFVHGITAPMWQLEQDNLKKREQWMREQQQQQQQDAKTAAEEAAKEADDAIAKANRGVMPLSVRDRASSKSSARKTGPIKLKTKVRSFNKGKKKKGGGQKRR